jgi:hypothetical protein
MRADSRRIELRAAGAAEGSGWPLPAELDEGQLEAMLFRRCNMFFTIRVSTRIRLCAKLRLQ